MRPWWLIVFLWITPGRDIGGEIGADRRVTLQRSERELNDNRVFEIFNVTAYTASVDECDDTPFETVDGSHVRPGICAVDPQIYPLGTRFVVAGDTLTALDTGSKIKGRSLDVFTWRSCEKHRLERLPLECRNCRRISKRAAMDFGRRKMSVEILP